MALTGSCEVFAPISTSHGISKVTTIMKESSFQEEFVDKQKSVSANNAKDAVTDAVENHLDHQKAVFDDMSDFFNSDEATPPEVVPVLNYLVKTALEQCIANQVLEEDDDGSIRKVKVLDIGCGTGALFDFYIKAANELGVELDITGLDLSPKMVDFANENAKALLESNDGEHSILCKSGDFVNSVMGIGGSVNESLVGFENGVMNDDTTEYRNQFDMVMINACFGNFFDLNSPTTAAANSLKTGGVFAIAHPLGASFVEKLHKENTATVPNCLPSKNEFENMIQFQPIAMIDFQFESTIDGEQKEIYLATAVKKPHRMLRDIVRLRGKVDNGYGRGGKKLGFPTANLPSSLFADALENVPTGVYIGGAVIEKSDDNAEGRGITHKAVVNVGYSPTFDGQENKEKIVEAHLILGEEKLTDFYGETMRLALSGYLRPEMKFPSFPDLIKAITNDVKNADESLDVEPYSRFLKNDSFLNDNEMTWIGTSGGDEEASYEFSSTIDF